VIGVFFLPWAVQLPGQFSKIQNAFWTPKPGIVEILQVMIQFTANLPLPNIYWIGMAAVLTVQIGIILLLESKRIQGKREEQLFMGVMILTGPMLTFAVSYLVRPIFLARGFLVCSMFFYGYAGWIISKRWKTVIGTLLLGCFVISALMGLTYQLGFNSFPRSPFQQAGLFLEGVKGDGIKIVHDNKLSYFPTRFFDPNLKQVFLADEAGSSNDTLAVQTQAALAIFPKKDMQTAAGDSGEIYFVVFQQTLDEYQLMNEPHPALAWLDVHFQSPQLFHFNDLVIYHYSQRK